MKKRYIASPLLILTIAAVWNISIKSKAPIANAEAVAPYITPQTNDPRHPIDVFTVGITGGENELDVLRGLPTTIYPEDKVTFKLDPEWGLGTIVHVQRAMPLHIQYGRRSFDVRTWSDTVAEVLEEKNLTLGDLDKSNVKNSDKLAANMAIDIVPVSKVEVTQKEVIAYETVEKADPNVYRPEIKVTQEGKNGERTKVYEITREDGIEVSRRLIKNEVTKTAVNKVVSKGSKDKVGKVASGKATYYDLCCTKVASTTFKKGTYLKLTNKNNGKSIRVRVDDTGAFSSAVVVDLNPKYFEDLGGTRGMGVLTNILAEEILNP